MRVFAHGPQHNDRQNSTDAKFPAPCLPVTWEESLQALAGRTLKDYKNQRCLFEGITPWSTAMTPKMKATWRMMVGTALLWVALAGLTRAPANSGDATSLIVAVMGFFAFATGIALFADGLKRDIVQQLRREPPAG